MNGNVDYYDLNGPGERIFVYKQPQRQGHTFTKRKTVSTTSSPSFSERLTDKIDQYQNDEGSFTDPMYWIYLLVAFGILTFVVLGFYWILQAGRAAVARKRVATTLAIRRAEIEALQDNQRRLLAIQQQEQQGLAAPAIPKSSVLLDTRGRNPELCRSGTCPSTASAANSIDFTNSNSLNSLTTNSISSNSSSSSSPPKLTFSPSTGLIPTAVGGTIIGGLGRGDVCIGCRCAGCEIPGRCNNVHQTPRGIPYLSSDSLAVRIGQGYRKDPYLN